MGMGTASDRRQTWRRRNTAVVHWTTGTYDIRHRRCRPGHLRPARPTYRLVSCVDSSGTMEGKRSSDQCSTSSICRRRSARSAAASCSSNP